jgi:hypothetical protein
MFGPDMNSNIPRVCGSHDFSGDVVAKFFLQGTTSTTPLCDTCVFAESNQFFSRQDTNISDPNNGLVMMTTYRSYLAAHYQHALVAIV